MEMILGRPVIGYLFERLSQCQLLDKIVLATSVNPLDDELCAYIKSEGFNVFRGSEEDVLERFYMAAKPYQPDHIARITGDCPCLDPVVCDRLFQLYLEKKVDHAELSPNFPEGADCEIFTFKALEEAYEKASLKSEREHVSLYLNNHSEDYQKILLDNPTDDSRYRITVDEPEDFTVIESVFNALYQEKSPTFSLEDIKQYLAAHPEIMKLNSYIMRNEGLKISLENDSVVKEKED